MSKPKILIFAPREEPPETVNALEGLGCELVFGDRDWQLPRTTHEDAVVEAARDAVALMGTSMRHTPISRRIMQASQRLRIVAKYTVGIDDVDTEAATELGIMVCHAPTESNCFGVAETTIAFMLSLLKKVAERDADVRAGKWRTADNFAYYVGSRASDGFPGQTIGLVGLGRMRGSPNCWRPGARGSSPTIPTCRPRISSPTESRRSLTRRCCGSRTWCRSTSCSRRRRATCSAKPSSS